MKMSKFCSKCGKPLDLNSKFCTGCGEKNKFYEKMNFKSRKILLFTMAGILLIVLAIVSLCITAFYFYNQQQTIKKYPNQAKEETAPQAEVERIVGLVGKLMDLPKDETPTLATVLDKDKLKDQPFFSSAQNGDVILIYTKAKKAIVYRQKDNKIIAVGPISIDESNQ